MSQDNDTNGTPTAATTPPTAPAEGLKITCKFVRPQRGGRVTIIEPGTEPVEKPVDAPPPVPTIVRSLVRAHSYERLIRSGAAKSYADVAAQVKQTTARLSQLAMLLNLSPDIQAEILDLASPENRGVIVDEKEVRRIANEPDWVKQREAWRSLRSKNESPTDADVEEDLSATITANEAVSGRKTLRSRR